MINLFNLKNSIIGWLSGVSGIKNKHKIVIGGLYRYNISPEYGVLIKNGKYAHVLFLDVERNVNENNHVYFTIKPNAPVVVIISEDFFRNITYNQNWLDQYYTKIKNYQINEKIEYPKTWEDRIKLYA